LELYKRKDGRSPWWQLDYVHPVTGARKRTSLKVKGTKAEAQKIAARFLADLEAKRGKTEATLSDALEAYCTALESDGKASAGEQRKLAVKCLQGLGKGRFTLDGSLALTDIKPPLLAGLVTARRREGNGNQTIAHEIKLIRAATRHAAGLGHAVNMEMFSGTIKDAWRMPRLPMKTRYLSMEEFQLVYAHLDPERPIEGASRGQPVSYTLPPDSRAYRQRRDAQDLLVALAMCGGRWSEVLSLLWERVDTERKVIRLWGNKTQRERLVGMPALLHRMLVRRLQERKTGQPLVFPSLGGKLRTSSSRSIQRAIDACGLNTAARVQENGRATIHSLRHTFASLLAQNGASLAEISDALGHTSLAMTRRYAHLNKTESAARLAGILDGAMRPAGGTLSTQDGLSAPLESVEVHPVTP
jgi:integrase